MIEVGKYADLCCLSREYKTALAPPYIAAIDKRNHSEGGPRGIVIGKLKIRTRQ
jgi:hypothetical protein